MFSVYGRSRLTAKKTINKKLLINKSDVNEAINDIGNATQEQKQEVIDDFVQREFISCSIKRCTHEFSTPEIVKEALVIMKKDTYNFSDLILMKKVNKLNANGEQLSNKLTNKPKLIWVKLN